jgi:hypothetical protein
VAVLRDTTLPEKHPVVDIQRRCPGKSKPRKITLRGFVLSSYADLKTRYQNIVPVDFGAPKI